MCQPSELEISGERRAQIGDYLEGDSCEGHHDNLRGVSGRPPGKRWLLSKVVTGESETCDPRTTNCRDNDLVRLVAQRNLLARPTVLEAPSSSVYGERSSIPAAQSAAITQPRYRADPTDGNSTPSAPVTPKKQKARTLHLPLAT